MRCHLDVTSLWPERLFVVEVFGPMAHLIRTPITDGRQQKWQSQAAVFTREAFLTDMSRPKAGFYLMQLRHALRHRSNCKSPRIDLVKSATEYS
jgi:hypothetical protein